MSINSYKKTQWVNDTVPPINETNLDNIEDGIANSIRTYSPSASSSLMKPITCLRYNQGYVEFYLGQQDQPEDESLWGKAAVRGETGITYVPSISEDGILSWTNDGELQNPDDLYIAGTRVGYKGVWQSGNTYYYNEREIDIVSYNDLVYMCISDNNTSNPEETVGSSWLLLAPKPADGKDGIDAAQLKFQGTWNADTNYHNNAEQIDIVAYNGSSYAALADSLAKRPDVSGTYWILLAQKGDKGDTGAQGIQGTKYYWTGPYNEETIYRNNVNYIDICFYEGSTYICLVDNTQDVIPTDTSAWAPMAEKGQNFTPKGSYDTIESLTDDHPVGNYGDVYTVGTDLYYWNIDTNSWYNLGTYRGPTGAQGQPGQDGLDGAPGKDGVGLPTGGLTSQILQKKSNEDYDFEWSDPPDAGAILVLRYCNTPIGEEWTSVSDYFTAEVAVDGMTADMNPIVGINMSFNSDTTNQDIINELQTEYSKIVYMETGEGKLILYAFEVPNISIPLTIKGQ